jgi:dTDP-4-dehydrorhamnose 3,5-epimerase
VEDVGLRAELMIFRETKIAGAFVVELERRVDDRGSFARAWCAREFEQRGLNPRLVQCNVSANERKGTLRGLHYSVAPHAETKLVRCVRGAVYDVLLDLRQGSPTSRMWMAEVLTPDNGLALYIPEGVAHGYQTLEDGSDVLYHVSEFYDPSCDRGVRWNDPSFGIHWPHAERILSERDRTCPDFDDRAAPRTNAR